MKTKLVLLTATILVGFGLLTSCQSTTSFGSTAAVACPKCKTVWVNAGASGGRGNPIALKATGVMQCPDCENTATAMLKGLTINTHTCKTCGATMFHCKQ